MTLSRRGSILLEVLVALTVLGLAGLTMVELVAGSARATVHAVAREREVIDQDRLLAAYTLLDRRGLQERVGTHAVGPYAVRIERIDFELFRVAVGRAGEPPELETVVYRPDPAGE